MFNVSFAHLFPCRICSVISAVVQWQGTGGGGVYRRDHSGDSCVCVMERWLSYFRPREECKTGAKTDNLYSSHQVGVRSMQFDSLIFLLESCITQGHAS